MNSASTIFRDTLVTIVLYETEPEKCSTYSSLSHALQHAGEKMDLFFYDNSPAWQKIPHSDHWTMKYEHNPANGGVSQAYNRACEVAKALDKKWLWFWDQDDVVAEDAIGVFQKALGENSIENVFVPMVADEKSICSPFRFQLGGGWRLKKINPGVYNFSRLKFINSGLFISVEAFEKSGGYDIDFPLDFSDIVFIERLRKEYNRFMVVSTTVHHRLSASSQNKLESDLTRFLFYLNGVRLYQKKYGASMSPISLRLFVRAVKLCLRHNSLRFLREYF